MAVIDDVQYIVLKIVCWWHQRENVFKKGTKRELAKVFLQMTRAHSKKELEALKAKAKEIAQNDVEILSSGKFEDFLDNCSKTALISLKIFTGGTVTNSYSESINSILRRAGLKTHYCMLTVLRYLDNFSVQHNCPKKYRFRSSDELLSVIIDETIDKALCHFSKKVQQSLHISIHGFLPHIISNLSFLNPTKVNNNIGR